MARNPALRQRRYVFDRIAKEMRIMPFGKTVDSYIYRQWLTRLPQAVRKKSTRTGKTTYKRR